VRAALAYGAAKPRRLARRLLSQGTRRPRCAVASVPGRGQELRVDRRGAPAAGWLLRLGRRQPRSREAQAPILAQPSFPPPHAARVVPERLSSAIHTNVKSSLIMLLSCGNILKPPTDLPGLAVIVRRARP
jgi:hypothetical protein